MKGENVLMVEDAPTTELEGGVSHDFGTCLLTHALDKYCHFFDVLFQEVLATLEMDFISVQADLLATDPRYNIRRESGQPGSEYDIFTKQHLAEMLYLREDMLKPGGHAHVICSSIQLSLWTDALRH